MGVDKKEIYLSFSGAEIDKLLKKASTDIDKAQATATEAKRTGDRAEKKVDQALEDIKDINTELNSFDPKNIIFKNGLQTTYDFGKI